MNLKAAAIIANVRGSDLASRFGVSPGTISKWLARRTPVPDRIKAEFAKMIGVEVCDLLPVPETECEEAGRQ